MNEQEQIQSDQLGKYAFAPERKKIAKEEVPDEPNTEYEQELYDAITDHVNGRNKHLDPKHTAMIKKFLGAGQHGNVFKSPRGVKIYRGEAIGEEKLKKILGLGENDKIPGSFGEKKVDYLWKNPHRSGGRNAGSSWTTDFNVAMGEFADTNVKRKRPIKIVYHAKGDQLDNFVNMSADSGSSNSGLYRIIPSAYPNEFEVIALGPIQVEEVTWEYADPWSLQYK